MKLFDLRAVSGDNKRAGHKQRWLDLTVLAVCLFITSCSGTLRVSSTPSGATVFIKRELRGLKNYSAVGKTPFSGSAFAVSWVKVRWNDGTESENFCTIPNPFWQGDRSVNFNKDRYSSAGSNIVLDSEHPPKSTTKLETLASRPTPLTTEEPTPSSAPVQASPFIPPQSPIDKALHPPTENGLRWAVIIGISEYKHTGRNDLANLIFADDDAKAFARVLRNLGWSESHMKLLVNKEATQRNIIIALESWLTKAGPDDQVVLFWAGHGFPDPEDPEKVYFACYDTDISIPATGYRMDRVRAALEERRTRNVVVFADTCHAGKLITRGRRGISIMPKIDQMRRENRIPKGWIFMVGADTDRKAIENTSWRNGAFTHCLLNALSGKADGYMSSGAKDGIVTMGELRTYMNSVMPDETQKVIGVAKRPVITTSTGDPEIWELSLQNR